MADALKLWGQLLTAKGDLDGAMAKWEESLLASPRTSRALKYIVNGLRKQGRMDEVLKRLQQRTVDYPGESYAWSTLANISHYDNGDEAAAKRYNNKALALNPHDADAMFNEAQLLLYRDPVASLAIGDRMERAVRLTQDPTMRGLALQVQSNALEFMREHERAKFLVESYIAAEPLSAIGYYRLAQVLALMHDFEGAITAADKAIAMGSRGAYLMRVDALIGKGDFESARRDIEVNFKGYPRFALLALGDIHIKQKQPAAAAEKYREMIALAPGRATGYAHLGRALAAQGDMRGAEQQFRKPAELGPKIGDPYFYWGEMLAANGDHAGAIKNYKQALAFHPKWGEPYALWGDALAAQGDTAGAKEKHAKALELEPKNPAFQKYKTKP